MVSEKVEFVYIYIYDTDSSIKWIHSTSSETSFIEEPPGVWGEQGNTGNLAMGTREQSKKIVGNKGTSNRLGTRGTNKKLRGPTFSHKRGGERRFSAVF